MLLVLAHIILIILIIVMNLNIVMNLKFMDPPSFLLRHDYLGHPSSNLMCQLLKLG